MIKVELHSHSCEDPQDRIPYSTRDLINRAAALGYGALAVTLHDRQLDVRPLEAYAMERGLVLIPGIERTVQGRHVLLLNFSEAASQVETLDDIRRLKSKEAGIVVAPHPFFPASMSLRGQMTPNADLFDAVEYNAFHTAAINFNRPAQRWATAHGKPMVGNCDVHRLEQLGTTYSLVDAEPNAAAICSAIVAGRVRVVSEPISSLAAARILGSLLFAKYFTPPSPSAEPSQIPA